MKKYNETEERQKWQNWNQKVDPDDRMTFNEWLSELDYKIIEEDEIYENY